MDFANWTNEQISARLRRTLNENLNLIKRLESLPGMHSERREMIAQYQGHAEMLAMAIEAHQ